jgi:hypothetical protein
MALDVLDADVAVTDIPSAVAADPRKSALPDGEETQGRRAGRSDPVVRRRRRAHKLVEIDARSRRIIIVRACPT